MHPPERKREALELVAAGLNDCEISRRLGIPRPTIRDWRRPKYEPKVIVHTCPRCGEASKPIRFSIDDYSELFAMYLGDGCISKMGRTYRLRIFLDAKYPQIIRDAHDLVQRVFPHNEVDIVDFKGGKYISVYNKHLPCLLPQHGLKKKHERPISPEIWQWALITAAPWPFIRGCIRTDGCAFVNRTGPYEYLSYHFTNVSRDIALLFTFALRVVGVDYRLTNGCKRGINNVRINRRQSVALMVKHVGLKA